MNVQIETEPHCVTTLRIELPADAVQATEDRVVNDFHRYAKIPGFRPGRVPRNVVQTRFKKQIDEEIERTLVSDACRKAIKDKGLRVLSGGEVKDVERGADRSMRFAVRLVTVPDFELPEYKGLAVKVPSAEVTPADVDAALEDLRGQHAEFLDIEGRGLEWDDFAVIDYKGTADGKPILEAFPSVGEPLDGRSGFWIRMTPEAFLPGFCDQLLGATAGETRKVAVRVPEDFVIKEMVGISLDYEVSVRELKTRKLPELDEAFAGSLVKGFTMEKLRAVTEEQIKREKASRAESEKRNQAIGQLLDAVTCDLPQGMVRNETRRILSDIVEENQARGVADEVLKQHEQELLGMASRNAENKVKATFILLKVAEKEGIVVTKEDLAQHLMSLSYRLQMPAKKLIKELEKRNAMDQINQEILTGKALDFLASNASVETVSAQPEA